METDPNGIDAHAPGAKLDSGKLLAGVLEDFAPALHAVAEVGSFGAYKYSRMGWTHVPNAEVRYTDAAWRHRLARLMGEELDKDSGLSHLAHECWNMLAILTFKLKEKEQDGVDNRG